MVRVRGENDLSRRRSLWLEVSGADKDAFYRHAHRRYGPDDGYTQSWLRELMTSGTTRWPFRTDEAKLLAEDLAEMRLTALANEVAVWAWLPASMALEDRARELEREALEVIPFYRSEAEEARRRLRYAA